MREGERLANQANAAGEAADAAKYAAFDHRTAIFLELLHALDPTHFDAWPSERRTCDAGTIAVW